ncbi:hypothetical protein BHE74_00020356 [Ensete ventricosum]|nr:hypothetical protein BHE74_00020356 [Ensete ventricosum]RZS03394.1 hypothetical protein BHM03_00033563 [Ensete ventricosum]
MKISVGQWIQRLESGLTKGRLSHARIIDVQLRDPRRPRPLLLVKRRSLYRITSAEEHFPLTADLPLPSSFAGDSCYWRRSVGLFRVSRQLYSASRFDYHQYLVSFFAVVIFLPPFSQHQPSKVDEPNPKKIASYFPAIVGPPSPLLRRTHLGRHPPLCRHRTPTTPSSCGINHMIASQRLMMLLAHPLRCPQRAIAYQATSGIRSLEAVPATPSSPPRTARLFRPSPASASLLGSLRNLRSSPTLDETTHPDDHRQLLKDSASDAKHGGRRSIEERVGGGLVLGKRGRRDQDLAPMMPDTTLWSGWSFPLSPSLALEKADRSILVSIRFAYGIYLLGE